MELLIEMFMYAAAKHTLVEQYNRSKYCKLIEKI